jgi:hypothetical protein
MGKFAYNSLVTNPYPLKTSFDRKQGRKDSKTTTLEPKNDEIWEFG